MQSWLQVQASVELALVSGQALSGLAVDLVKAFNNIRRPQWFTLARHLGLPERILQPWHKFLASFTRRFQVHNHLSKPLTSDIGFAEGDPLSVPAMAVLDWALHVYQSQYAPMTRTMSFVDNISMMSRFVMNLVWVFSHCDHFWICGAWKLISTNPIPGVLCRRREQNWHLWGFKLLRTSQSWGDP